MEAVKNRLTSLLRNAGPLVVNPDADLVPDACDRNLDQSAGRREAYGVIDDRIDRARKAVRFAHHHSTIRARPGEGEAGVTRFAARFPAVHQLLDQRAQIDSLEGGARQLSVGARSLTDIADEPVEAGDVFRSEEH